MGNKSSRWVQAECSEERRCSNLIYIEHYQALSFEWFVKINYHAPSTQVRTYSRSMSNPEVCIIKVTGTVYLFYNPRNVRNVFYSFMNCIKPSR